MTIKDQRQLCLNPEEGIKEQVNLDYGTDWKQIEGTHASFSFY